MMTVISFLLVFISCGLLGNLNAKADLYKKSKWNNIYGIVIILTLCVLIMFVFYGEKQVKSLNEQIELIDVNIESKKFKTMKTENMTGHEALKLAEQGVKVRLSFWNGGSYIVKDGNNFKDSYGDLVQNIPIDYFLDDRWEIYNESKPKPQFEIGEIVMVRDSWESVWLPKHFSYISDDTDEEEDHEFPYCTIDGCCYRYCAKFDKDIVFTNKPAKQ